MYCAVVPSLLVAGPLIDHCATSVAATMSLIVVVTLFAFASIPMVSPVVLAGLASEMV